MEDSKFKVVNSDGVTCDTECPQVSSNESPILERKIPFRCSFRNVKSTFYSSFRSRRDFTLPTHKMYSSMKTKSDSKYGYKDKPKNTRIYNLKSNFNSLARILKPGSKAVNPETTTNSKCSHNLNKLCSSDHAVPGNLDQNKVDEVMRPKVQRIYESSIAVGPRQPFMVSQKPTRNPLQEHNFNFYSNSIGNSKFSDGFVFKFDSVASNSVPISIPKGKENVSEVHTARRLQTKYIAPAVPQRRSRLCKITSDANDKNFLNTRDNNIYFNDNCNVAPSDEVRDNKPQGANKNKEDKDQVVDFMKDPARTFIYPDERKIKDSIVQPDSLYPSNYNARNDFDIPKLKTDFSEPEVRINDFKFNPTYVRVSKLEDNLSNLQISAKNDTGACANVKPECSRKPKVLLRKKLKRSKTFGAYENMAFRISLPNSPNEAPPSYSLDTTLDIDKNIANMRSRLSNKFKPDNFPPDFVAAKRIDSYRLPVTSFYIPKKESYNNNAEVRTLPDYREVEPTIKRRSSFGYVTDDNFLFHKPLLRRSSFSNNPEKAASCHVRSTPNLLYRIPKQRKPQPNFDIHVHALFAAVEHGHFEKAKTILESSDVDVNSTNSDGLSLLDVAVLSSHRPLVKLLISYGAQEGKKFYSSDDLRNHLQYLLHEAERRVDELDCNGNALPLLLDNDHRLLSASNTNIPSIVVSDSHQSKTLSLWQRRSKGLKKMLTGFEQIRPPDAPAHVSVEVTSSGSLVVYFQEPSSKDALPPTKYNVQWSTEPNFGTLRGYYEITDPRVFKYHIRNLRRGQRYYARVACGNVKGYSPFKNSSPPSVIPSSWKDVEERESRFTCAVKRTLDEVYNRMIEFHPGLKTDPDTYGLPGDLLPSQRKKKTTIKQLFTAASKFQKHLRRGVYLSCLLYHEDKVLVTNEDFLPVVEVDETYPKTICGDFHWFFKIAFSWSDVKWLRNDMEKTSNNSCMFRIKLLQAAIQMQTALSIQDLGKLHHKVIRDSEGTIVIPLVNYIHSPKAVSLLNLRWLPISKLNKRVNLINFSQSNVGDVLMSSIPEQITYHQVSNIKLSRGLYLGYLKIQSSVDTLQVLVPTRTPNIPPHCKIRDNPHVTSEEWEWLTKMPNLSEAMKNSLPHQRLFVEQVAVTMKRLFAYMEIPECDTGLQRLYDVEVIEVSEGDVSVIMVVPPVDAACSMPGQRELLLQRPDLLPLTIQVFEMVHFSSYQPDLVSLYSKLGCVLEIDVDEAQHALRKAFSATEVSCAKEQLAVIESLHSQLNATWKQARWLLDVISFARDRCANPPDHNNMQTLLSIQPQKMVSPSKTFDFLQPPEPKNVKARGSWPGVGGSRVLGHMPSDMSRSEQRLSAEHTSNSSLPPPLPPRPSLMESKSADEKLFNKRDMPCISYSKSEEILATSSQPIFTEKSQYEKIDISQSSKIQKNEQDPMKMDREEDPTIPVRTSAVIQVFAAYETGLSSSTSLKLHVSQKTCAREVVESFMKRINMSVVLKGESGPIYPSAQFAEFCLVAIVGARERCLRDDFKPLMLQKPWKDGRLYIRKKCDVLAAIEKDATRQGASYV